jgi:hypothetical protein
MVQEYQGIAGALEAYVDVYLAETLATLQEAQAAAIATKDTGKEAGRMVSNSAFCILIGLLAGEGVTGCDKA